MQIGIRCSAIINDSIQRSECDYNRISNATKDKRFISGIRKVLDAEGFTLVVWIHGIKESSRKSERTKMKVSGLDCLIGYGQPDNLSARKETATNLANLLQKHGLHAHETRKTAENFRGADPDNMNQWFQKQKKYKSLDKVQSLQLEFALSSREIRNVGATASLKVWVTYGDVEVFISELKCSAKRINNILVPMRALMKFAFKDGLIEKNPMALVENLKVVRPSINPLSMDEVHKFLAAVRPFYKPFFIVAFFTGMRFGEMAGLKWKNVDFKLGVVRVQETRVRGEEGRPKTKGSVRDIKMLPPVVEAFREQRKITMGHSDYVFLNKFGRPLLPNSIHFHVWKPGLRKAGLKARSLYQTRHTFATLMLDGGELPGWVQKMMGHESLKMILERYYSYIKNYERDDGLAFMEKVYRPSQNHQKQEEGKEGTAKNLTPNLPQNEKRESA